MLGWILLLIGIGGFGLGAYWDLRTTEFPDWLPYSIIVAALIVRGAFSFILGDFSVIINSVIFGLGFLGFGYLLYFLKQWGDGDAWLMGALGFLFPDAAGFVPLIAGFMPFPLLMIFNFFLVALIYLIIYSIALGIRTPKVYRTFMKNVHRMKHAIGCVFIILVVASVAVSLYLSYNFPVPINSLSGLFTMPFAAVAILLFFQYAKAVEGDLFKRKIKAKDLRVGDVLIADKWRGITEDEVKKLKKKGGEVWIKEGVRFAPVFVINIIVTLFLGSLMGLIFPVV